VKAIMVSSSFRLVDHGCQNMVKNGAQKTPKLELAKLLQECEQFSSCSKEISCANSSLSVGCSLLDVLSDIDRLCQANRYPVAKTSDNSEDAYPIAGGTRSSPERIWKLLRDHPQISIGLDRQYNALTLADLWNHNAAALARIYFVAHPGNQNRNWHVAGPGAEKSWSSTSQSPPDTTVKQAGLAKRGHLPLSSTNLTESATNQPETMKVTEPVSSVLDKQTPIIFDEQSTAAGTQQSSVKRGRRVEHNPSRHTTEANEGSNQPSQRADSESTRNASAVSARPGDTDARMPMRHTSVSNIAPRLHAEGPTQELIDLPRSKGGRKYLRGTEGFWNEMFWHTRNQCEGRVTPRFTHGIATHPGARALYAKRPIGIDEVILGAIEAGLPLPIDPQDITCAWRDRTAWVLNRSQEGIYISPQGVRRVDSSQYADHSDAPLCQILILRSNRLREVVCAETEQHTNSQPPLSSTAHTFRPQSFFSLQPTSTTGPFGPQPPTSKREKNLSFMFPALGSALPRGPPLGVFEPPENDSSDMSIPSIVPSELAAAPVRCIRVWGASVTAENTSLVDSRSRATTVSLESPELPVEQHASPVVESWRGLPPPLTTRSRKPKLSEDLSAAKGSPKRRKRDGTAGGVAASGNILVKPIEATIDRPIDMVDVDIDTPKTLFSRDSTLDRAPPQKLKAPRKKAVREDRKEFLKQILLEVIDECGGMIPNDYLCISDYVNARYRARVKSGQPDKKTCKEMIKSFCTNGRLKRLAFTFQRQSGVMATRTILANLDVDATSEEVARLQQNIINALPGLYVPPLGSILDASLIEAPSSDTPPSLVPPAKRSSASNTAKHKMAAVRRLRTRKGARKDVLGTSPARRPFTWHGSPQLVPIHGSEDHLALAFAYVAATRSHTGHAIWANANVGLTDEDFLRAERTTAIPKAFISIRRPNVPSRGSNDHTRSRNGPDKLNWRTQKPITSLTFNPEAHDAAMNEATTCAGAPKFGRSSRGRKIIWKTRESEVLPPPFPSSLQDILDMPGQIPRIDYSMTEDPVTNFFFWELDAVEYWEGNILKIYQQRAPDWTFINHIFDQWSVPGLPVYPHLQWTDPNILTTATFTPQPIYIKRAKPTRKQKPTEAVAEEIDHESVDSDYDPIAEGMAQGPIQKTRRRSSLQPTRRPKESARRRRPAKPQVRPSEGERVPPERQSRPRILQNMAGEEIYRIVIAVIVVRTLAGGITGEIDWSIVHKLCPNRDAAFLAHRWSTLLVKNRQDIASLTESMQKKYIVAYEDGEVPCVDFDDLEHTDWEAIRSWAEQKLDKNLSDDIDALPNARSELLRTTKFTFNEQQTLRDAFGPTFRQPQAMREEILARTPAAVQLYEPTDTIISLRVESEVEEEDFNLSLARSWAFATITTSEESLNHSAVTEKLMSITSDTKEADQLFDRAIKVLQRNQVITRNKNFTPGQWRVNERWFEIFETRRMITASMLRKAVAWKRDVLDPAVLRGQSVLIDKMQIMHDGEMVAIVNMVANGRCKITAGPAGLPRGRYGLDPDAKSYNTKGMSRLLTLFATTIRPTQGYVVGDPMAAERLEIPCWQDGGRGKIPCWIDMNGKVLMRIWEMVISAVVGLLSGRPGISAVEILRSLGHAVTKWEVETVLAWLAGSGFARRTEHGIGWETKEWWWMVCGFDTHDTSS
jgi:hypothetical protein